MTQKTQKLVADFGGTHLRIGFSDGFGITDLSKIRYKSDVSALELISDYAKINNNKIEQIRICAAGPVENDKIEITNSKLIISKKEIMSFFKISDVYIFNDAEAACYYLPEIKTSSYSTINRTEPKNQNFAYIALGTGLGVSCVKQHNNKSTVISGEGGYCHIPYPEKRRTSRDVINIIENDYPRVSSERLISGLGLTLIYEALTKINKDSIKLTSEEIVASAITNKKGLEYEACKILFELLGKFAASISLIYGARGGVFLSGGLLERLYPILPDDLILKNFLISGRMKNYIKQIPLHIINDDLISLMGCAVYKK